MVKMRELKEVRAYLKHKKVRLTTGFPLCPKEQQKTRLVGMNHLLEVYLSLELNSYLCIQSQVAAFTPAMGLEQNPNTQFHKHNPESHPCSSGCTSFTNSLQKEKPKKPKRQMRGHHHKPGGCPLPKWVPTFRQGQCAGFSLSRSCSFQQEKSWGQDFLLGVSTCHVESGHPPLAEPEIMTPISDTLNNLTGTKRLNFKRWKFPQISPFSGRMRVPNTTSYGWQIMPCMTSPQQSRFIFISFPSAGRFRGTKGNSALSISKCTCLKHGQASTTG